jgi:hypothetical protein
MHSDIHETDFPRFLADHPERVLAITNERFAEVGGVCTRPCGVFTTIEQLVVVDVEF